MLIYSAFRCINQNMAKLRHTHGAPISCAARGGE